MRVEGWKHSSQLSCTTEHFGRNTGLLYAQSAVLNFSIPWPVISCVSASTENQKPGNPQPYLTQVGQDALSYYDETIF